MQESTSGLVERCRIPVVGPGPAVPGFAFSAKGAELLAQVQAQAELLTFDVALDLDREPTYRQGAMTRREQGVDLAAFGLDGFMLEVELRVCAKST